VELVTAEVLVHPVEEGQIQFGERGHNRSVWVRGASGQSGS
jgi:hypothetical protein